MPIILGEGDRRLEQYAMHVVIALSAEVAHGVVRGVESSHPSEAYARW